MKNREKIVESTIDILYNTIHEDEFSFNDEKCVREICDLTMSLYFELGKIIEKK